MWGAAQREFERSGVQSHLRSEHTKLDLNLLLCELLAREALAAKGERLLKLLFRAREVATADVSARDVVREFKLFR
eukprot:scaffold325822_cov57-Tisochrysis_lutea.AAC.5